MLRLNPAGYRRFYQANQMEVSYAGSEANVAVQLALLGHHSVFVSKVPAHEIGQCAVNELRRYGAVSYTHLDVYKRQAYGRYGNSGDPGELPGGCGNSGKRK